MNYESAEIARLRKELSEQGVECAALKLRVKMLENASEVEALKAERAELIETLKTVVTRGDVLTKMDARDAAIKLLSRYKYPKATAKEPKV